jgi:Domain of unknown function (DUF1707)
VSTAERSEVADALSQHYAEGRLDVNEFNERIELATNAKTRSDLASLTTDLPSPDTGARVPIRQRAHPRLRSGLVLAVVAGAAIWAMSAPHFGWIIATIVIFVVWRRIMGHGSHPYGDRAAGRMGHSRGD